MSPLAAFVLACGGTLALAPGGIALARRISFYDHPMGYKRHACATPYLGGLVVFAGFALAAALAGHLDGRFAVASACAAVLLVVGTLDDAFTLPPGWRVLAEVAAAIALDATGHGWTILPSDSANLLLTIIWVVGLVNAFNLMDNLDGATATVAGIAAAGIGGAALAGGDTVAAAFAFAVCGACVGFLPFNLARPARMFLGDGGSMPLGFLLAASAIAATNKDSLGGTALLAAALLVGLVILDTTLVVVSRRRAGVPVVTPGRDHLTHRLLVRMGTPRRVAVALALPQALLCGLAVVGVEAGSLALAVIATGCVVAGLAVIAWLESEAWCPVREPRRATAAPSPDRATAERRYGPVVSNVDAV